MLFSQTGDQTQRVFQKPQRRAPHQIPRPVHNPTLPGYVRDKRSCRCIGVVKVTECHTFTGNHQFTSNAFGDFVVKLVKNVDSRIRVRSTDGNKFSCIR